MARSTFPRDRFDDLPDPTGRVGAHRAENPRLRGWIIFLWAAIATLVLIIAGIFATLVVSGRISLGPDAEPTPTPTASATRPTPPAPTSSATTARTPWVAPALTSDAAAKSSTDASVAVVSARPDSSG